MSVWSELATRAMVGPVTEDRAPVRAQATVEHSAPRGALGSANFAQPGQRIYPDFDGQTAIRRGYERTMYVHRAINLIASSIAGLPFCVGNPETKVARPTHPVARLLGPPPGGPNPVWASAALWRYVIAQYLVLGKFALLHEYDDNGKIIGLWPLQAQYFYPIMCNPDSTKPSYFSGYEYGTVGDQGYRKFSLDQVTYCYRPSQSDFRKPESVLRTASTEINIKTLIAEYDQAFLVNGGVPAHLVVHPPFGTSGERRGFRDQFRRKFGGARQAGKVMFAERNVMPGEIGTSTPDPISVHTLGIAQKDSELSGLRDSTVQDLCVGLGVPLSMLSDSTRSKFTNMETDRKNFWENNKHTMRDLTDLIGQSPLMRSFGTTDACWFDTSEVPELQPVPSISDDNAPALLSAGLITVADYRDARGLPPIEEPDPLPVPDAPPAPVADPAPAPAPAANPSNVIPLRSRDADRRAVLDGLLLDQARGLLASQRAELDRRLAGGRGTRARVRAEEDITTAYDSEYWTEQAVQRLGPTLRALGLAELEVTEYATDLTAAVLDSLATDGHVDRTYDNALSQAERLLQPAAVSREDVVLALLGLEAGEHDAAAALGMVGG